jgi:hypothetical protein
LEGRCPTVPSPFLGRRPIVVTALTERAGTAETYLAGFGATGAVIAGVVSAFLLVVGVVTFDAWPRAATPFGPHAEVESVGTGETAAPAARLPEVDPLASRGVGASQPQTLGGGGETAPVPGEGGGRDRGGDTAPGGGRAPGGGGQAPAGTAPGTGGGSAGGAGASSSGGGTLQETVNGLGETVDDTVSGLGQTVNDTVSGLGQTVDGTLDGVNRILNGLTNTGS